MLTAGGIATCASGILCWAGAPAIGLGVLEILAAGTVAVTSLRAVGEQAVAMSASSGGSSRQLPSREQLSESGKVMDRNGLTKSGRAYQKHSDRAGSVFPKPPSKKPEVLNRIGQRILDEILYHPQSVMRIKRLRYYGDVIEIWIPGKYGARFTLSGEFMGFLEP